MKLSGTNQSVTIAAGLAQMLLDWPMYQVVIIGNDNQPFQANGLTYGEDILVLSNPDNSLDTMEKIHLAKKHLTSKGKVE